MAIDIQDASRLHLRSSNNNGDVTGSSPILEPDISVGGTLTSAVVSAASGVAKDSTVSGSSKSDSNSHASQLGSITTDTTPINSATQATSTPTANATPIQASQANSTPTLDPAPQHGLSTSKLTAIIVVPIIFVAIVSPILIVWFASWRRKNQLLKGHHRRRTLHESKLLELQKSSPSVSSHGEEQNARSRANTHPRDSTQARNPTQVGNSIQTRNSAQPRNSAHVRSSTQTRFPVQPTTSPPPKTSSLLRPSTQPRSPAQSRTSNPPRNFAPPRSSTPLDPSFNNFNFDLPPRTSSRPLSPQPSVSPLSTRRSLPRIWSPPPAYTSRPMTLASPEFPPRIETPQLPHTPPLAPQGSFAPQRTTISSPAPTSNLFADPNLHAPSTSPSRPLSEGNLSVHNGANLRSPFSGLDSPAISDISGLSFDHSLWIATQGPGAGGSGFLAGARGEEFVSPLGEGEGEGERVEARHIV